MPSLCAMLAAAQLRFASGTDLNVLVVGDSQGREISLYGHMHILTQQTTASRLRAKLPGLVLGEPTFRFDWLGGRRWGSCVFPTDQVGAQYWLRSGTNAPPSNSASWYLGLERQKCTTGAEVVATFCQAQRAAGLAPPDVVVGWLGVNDLKSMYWRNGDAKPSLRADFEVFIAAINACGGPEASSSPTAGVLFAPMPLDATNAASRLYMGGQMPVYGRAELDPQPVRSAW